MLRQLAATVLENPGDAETMLLLGHTHLWKVAERARLEARDPMITDHLVVAEHYFEEAYRLNPGDHRGHAGRGRALTIHDDAEIYDPETGTFSPTGSMGIRRHKHDAVLLPDGRVLVTGGSDERDADGLYSSAELYDPATAAYDLRTGAFSVVSGAARMPGPYPAIALLRDGRVLITGGYGSDIRPRSEAWLYRP